MPSREINKPPGRSPPALRTGTGDRMKRLLLAAAVAACSSAPQTKPANEPATGATAAQPPSPANPPGAATAGTPSPAPPAAGQPATPPASGAPGSAVAH